MTISKDDFIKLLPSIYGDDVFYNALFTAIANVFNNALDAITAIKNEFFFDTMVFMVPIYERLMGLTIAASESLSVRRSRIKARWRNNGHNSVELLQNIADSWENGETKITLGGNNYLKIKNIRKMKVSALRCHKVADFITNNSFKGLRLVCMFISKIGSPSDLDVLKKELETAKPAHIPIIYKFKYLFVKDVRKMKINELRSQLIGNFAK